MCGLRGSSVFTVLFRGLSLRHMSHALNMERFNRIVKRCQRSREVSRSAEQNNWGSCETFFLLMWKLRIKPSPLSYPVDARNETQTSARAASAVFPDPSLQPLL